MPAEGAGRRIRRVNAVRQPKIVAAQTAVDAGVGIRAGRQVDAGSVQEEGLVTAADRHFFEFLGALSVFERGIRLIDDRNLAGDGDLRLLRRELQRYAEFGLS